MKVSLRGRRSIWCSWRVTPIAPRIVNDVAIFGEYTISFFVAGAAFRGGGCEITISWSDYPRFFFWRK